MYLKLYLLTKMAFKTRFIVELMLYVVFMSGLISKALSSPVERVRRQSPFSRMSGASPFHGGMMNGPMSGLSPMQGPTGMGPSRGGQSHAGGAAMFNPPRSGCIQNNVVCPKWCLIEDENGCKTCPCGPAGGMSAMAGGPSSGPMGSLMAMGGRGGGGSTSSSGTSHVTSPSSSAQATSVHTSGTSTTSSTSSTSGSHTQMYVTAVKPAKECAATLLCTSTCTSGYNLGATTSGGCRTCSCPNSHQVSTTTIHYIVQTVAPAQKECTHTAHCMGSCPSGYVMSETDGYGCPQCSCSKVTVPHETYQYPIEIAVEPPPGDRQPVTSYTLTCSARSCNAGCTVGYKCGPDGCPTCDCIHPSVVGITSVQPVYIHAPLTCRNSLSCPSTCSLGYKCGPDGCPTCQCLTTYVQPRPQYTVQTCTHTLTCAATCTHGYQMFSDGTGACQKCACKQPQVVYSVQRPTPQYQVVQCPSTDACASTCRHGYTVIRHEGRCPECQCKPAPVYYTVTGSGCTSNCHETGGSYYVASGTSSHTTGSGQGYILLGESGANNHVTGSSSISNVGRTNYIMTSGGSGASPGTTYTMGGRSSAVTGSNTSSCPPLPPNCDPLCIKYDEPHCRRCTCESAYFKFSQG